MTIKTFTSAAVGMVLVSICIGPVASAGPGETLADVVRRATAPYQDPAVAIAEGWLPAPACVSGPERGAMGIHYVNGALFDGVLDPERPEALIYEQQRNGGLRLVGVEFIELAATWLAAHGAPPVLMGQQFHYVGSPNRYGLDPFYELHVWAWKKNPAGTFADWNPHVSCDEFIGH